MPVVLGLDAAWTPDALSGVAVVAGRGSRWEVRGFAPSYESFFGQANGQRVDWAAGRFRGTAPEVDDLLAAAVDCAGESVTVVAIDMPIATRPFTNRREADNAVSVRFGGAGCSTHSPSRDRPGPLGANLTRDFHKRGFPIAACGVPPGTSPRLIEVYPHPALLSLLGRDYRVPYKVTKSKRYWPDDDPPTRIGKLLTELRAIHDALRAAFGETGLVLPSAASVKTISSLAKYEHALDALVCAWVGVQYLEGKAEPLGDETGAIWIPI